MMDVEPGRCRRTDGKKWRCHQSVIPNEKYCQKHMHRGSKRSRKLVETSPYSGSPNPIRCEFATNLDNVGPTTVMITPSGLTSIIVKSNVKDEQNDSMKASPYARNPNPIRYKFPDNLDSDGPTSAMIRTPCLPNTVAESNENEEEKNQLQRELAAKERIAVMNLASGLDISHKRALQNGKGYTRSETQKSTSETESMFNKIDGKICWCKKEVVPDHKFCAQHLSGKEVWTGKPSLGPLASSEPLISNASTSSSKFSRTELGKVGLNFAVDSNVKASALPLWLADFKNVIKDNVDVAQDGGSSSSSEATETDDEITGVWEIVARSP